MFDVKYTIVEPGAREPTQGTAGAAAFDLTAVSVKEIDDDIYEYDTGLAFEIPPGYVGLVVPRSSVSNVRAWMANSVGVIDSDYRGTVRVRLYAATQPYDPGERVAQIMFLPVPTARLTYTDTLSETQRGAGGFGSTGR